MSLKANETIINTTAEWYDDDTMYAKTTLGRTVCVVCPVKEENDNTWENMFKAVTRLLDTSNVTEVEQQKLVNPKTINWNTMEIKSTESAWYVKVEAKGGLLTMRISDNELSVMKFTEEYKYKAPFTIQRSDRNMKIILNACGFGY